MTTSLCWSCSETTQTGESRFHISTPQRIWIRVPCDGKQTGSPLDQWDMVRMKWDSSLSTGFPAAADSIGCEAGRKTCSKHETGTYKYFIVLFIFWGFFNPYFLNCDRVGVPARAPSSQFNNVFFHPVWDQEGLSHCLHGGLVTVQDKARLRRGHNDQSRRGHQCSETTLTGESRFHISTHRGFEPGSLVTGSKWVVQK